MDKAFSAKDRLYMKEALRLAAKGAGRTSPNPMVGAVVVRDDSIVGRGYHEMVGGPHAEVNALRDAGETARGATIYVTLEPCNHHGRTPPCTKAVLEAGIARVVIGMDDPNPHVEGSGGGFLREHGLIVQSGLLERECRLLNQPFIKHITTGLPYVTLKAASTLD
ncbi:MAG: bifunctional diaminohydroxyphosphoribosylaminopyrimidine deaminase/5-amino-6-(5-phosphoribosylamino)uracil reductase RibD, partial [Acidobacteriota bacterium]